MKAISSMATRFLLANLASAAVDAGLPRVDIESVGGVDAVRRVASGEQFDVVFLAADQLDKLAADGRVEPASLTPLVLSQVAVAVPSKSDDPAARPDGAAFADAGGLRDVLRAASRIGYSTGPSGTALVQAIDEWDLKGEIGDRLVQARAGIPVSRLLAEGDADLGFQQLSELVGQPGVRVLGILPPDCAIETVFSGAIATLSKHHAAAERFLKFLSTDESMRIKTEHGFQLV
ncbi:substrate-binding domain-containing protein [Microbacterium sp. UBA3394]|uniref:substrate-binding domain-containing protein n=1 Tax=Microbacterium sp. UBA3394 TaxID=1946945 RepID=UPI000C980F09|nr:substrate-binding domain-containing protein [Microbacterium sp. UBA3394]MAB77761.1 molybdenum ABC transporter substrate-binding protein [Planctomycetota bacterium]HAS32917.1 molybdenum ABC transporter substrate-binding protein [Microbacterium sp.]|tara:strand:+ start:27012 stop:27710 length:699 start_codon:yes stop_codon:yes gene_type:complete